MYETKIKVSLKSLLMEDLLRAVDSKHRIMVISSAQDSSAAARMRHNPFISNSCPDLVNLLATGNGVSSSLPDNLNQKKANIFENKNRTLCPDTPPPSPQPKTNQQTLVIYTAELVDPDCPTFASHYNSMRQTSNIDFNSLDLVVSVESWFVVLNFFGLLADNTAEDEQARKKSDSNAPIEAETAGGNTELNISVRSLTLVLNKPNYELAKANVSNAHFIVAKRGPAKTVDGRLGSISLVDMTKHGCVYRERFMTSGNEALNFVYAREALPLGAAHPSRLREDAKLKIQMSSVRFIYTKRFISEIQEFFREFSQLQMVSVSTESFHAKLTNRCHHGPRIRKKRKNNDLMTFFW
jgi:vacuolar protein sorting-associated protein 13D